MYIRLSFECCVMFICFVPLLWKYSNIVVQERTVGYVRKLHYLFFKVWSLRSNNYKGTILTWISSLKFFFHFCRHWNTPSFMPVMALSQISLENLLDMLESASLKAVLRIGWSCIKQSCANWKKIKQYDQDKSCLI